MNLLILGAGGHGRVVREVAEATGQYENIAFLDDNWNADDVVQNQSVMLQNQPDVIGKLSDYDKFTGQFDYAFVAIGNAVARKKYQELLIDRYEAATLIHPAAHISPSASVGKGAVVMAGAVVQTNSKIGAGCIISAGAIQQELIRKYGDYLNLETVIASVRDEKRLNEIFAENRPDIVFHAAAHKHVPLMEHSGCEAIKNNVLGTYNVANMAEKYGVQKFLLISTDKAVNPTNIMGASKRLCEMVIQCRTDSRTEFTAVRFGNVLGSNGSVIPLFKKQIESGGPITLTDKRIIRYFMTIPEAVGLVMETGAMAHNGELFVLDMGKPVKILDLAENMIRLSGLTPYKDIDIIEIGLRPGEKLYEELLMKTEELDKTPNKMIFIERDKAYTREEVDEKIKILMNAVEIEGYDAVVDAIKKTVPTYHNPDEVNRTASMSAEMKSVREVAATVAI